MPDPPRERRHGADPPGLSDRPELLAEVVRAARRRRDVWANVLYLKPGTRALPHEAVARDFPEQLPGTNGSTRAGRISPPRETKPVRGAGARARAGATASATAAEFGSENHRRARAAPFAV
jgi:hypothetical protein